MLRWNSLPGRRYIIDGSTDLTNWNEIEDSHPSGGLTTEYEVFGIDAGGVRHYYRITE